MARKKTQTPASSYRAPPEPSDHCNYALVGDPKPTTGATGRYPATIFQVACEGFFCCHQI